VINNNISDQVNNFNYLGYTITVTNNRDLEIKMNRFNQICSPIRILNKKTGEATQVKFYRTMAVLIRIRNLDQKKKKKQKLKLQK
jgi:hypothetical protein